MTRHRGRRPDEASLVYSVTNRQQTPSPSFVQRFECLTTPIQRAHQQLLREGWGPSHQDQAHYVRVYMAHLRHKLETEPARPRYLLTEPGVGYRLAAE